jgi:hypothetical protein
MLRSSKKVEIEAGLITLPKTSKNGPDNGHITFQQANFKKKTPVTA